MSHFSEAQELLGTGMPNGIRGRRVVVSQFPAIAGRIPVARIEMEEETTADEAEGV